ncbi:MAG: hypothetical protein ACI3XP_01940 [Eubacteriales bacterium]
MKKQCRLTALLLTALLLAPLAACSKSPTPSDTQPDTSSAAPDTETPVSGEPDTPAVTERSDFKDNIPADLRFGGDTVNVYYRDTIEVYNVYGTDNAGDVVTDAIWQRNLSVAERLNIEFNYIRSAASGTGDVAQSIRSAAAAGLNEWDIILTTNNTTVTNGMDNIMLELEKLPYLNLEQPYWWKDAMDNVSLTGDGYRYLVGDFMLLNFLRTGAFYYNKALYESVYGNPEEPYTLVLDGNWTYDEMLEKAQGAYHDTNGSGTTDAGDTVGYAIGSTYEEQMSQFAEGFDICTYKRGDDGSVTIDMGNEHIFDVSTRLYEIAHQSCALIVDNNLSAAGLQFTEGNVLFLPGRFDRVIQEAFRDMEDDYGILPYPKYDAEQKEYISLCHSSSGCGCVLVTLPQNRYELTGAVLEALGAETYRSVTGVFLETAMKMKYSRDSKSGQVIDIILAGIRKDLIHEYSSYTSGIYNVLVKNAPATEGVFISSYQKVSTAAQASLDKNIANLKNGK